MSPALLAASAIAIAGAVACVAGRRGAVIAAGTGLMLLAAATIADPLPPLLTIVVRAVGAALTAELLWVGLRARPAVAGASALPWPAITLLAGAAFVVGIGVTGEFAGGGGDDAAQGGAGPAAALGTALAFAVIAIAGAARRSDGVQRVLLALPLAAAAGLIETAFLGTPSALESTVLAGLAVAIAACLVVLATPVDESRTGVAMMGAGVAGLTADDLTDVPDSALNGLGSTSLARRRGSPSEQGRRGPAARPAAASLEGTTAPPALDDEATERP